MKRRTWTMEYTACNSLPAVCEIEEIETAGDKLIIVTDCDTGPSVTNNVEQVATELRLRGVNWDVFIEHYPPADFKSRTGLIDRLRDETFDQVKFEWHDGVAYNPEWKHTDRETVEAYIGGAF